VVGLGQLGSELAARLLGSGFDVRVHDQRQDRMAGMATDGAFPCVLPADAAEDATLVIVRLPHERAADEVLFAAGGIAETLPDGAFVLDLSEVSPQYSMAATARLAGYGITRLEAWVLSTRADTRLGGATLFVGGAGQDVVSMTPVTKALATTVVHVGAVGTAARIGRWYEALVAEGFDAAAGTLLRSVRTRALAV
jgi:3-hydroxyisobutyrate dehydrogenase-like beta-hydroxyacid dehydrogenase